MSEYTEKAYVTKLKTDLTALLNELEEEFTKQSRRHNKESEKRTRKLLSTMHETLYRPYKKASLEELGETPETSEE